MVHVGDILVTGSEEGRKKFAEAIGAFEHIGIEDTKEGGSIAHLWLEIVRKGNSSRLQQNDYVRDRIREVLIEDAVRGGA